MTTISKFKNFQNEDVKLDEYLNIFEDKEGDKPSTWKKIMDRVVDDLGLNFLFLGTFATSIAAFFPVVESLMKNMNLDDVEINRETIVMLSICALAIIFNEEKPKYKKMFEELRLRGVYDSLKKLVSEMDFIKKIFKFFARNTGKLIVTFTDMFGYTSLLVPFLHALHVIASTKGISIETLSEVMNAGDLLAFTVGIGTFTVKNLLIELVQKIKSFTSIWRVPVFTKTVDKLTLTEDELDEIGKDFNLQPFSNDVDDGDIKKYSDYTDQDLIQDDYVNESAANFDLFGAMEKIRNKYPKSDVTTMVDEEIFGGDWLNEGWEEDYDDEWDAYLETGGGEAEDAIIQQIKTWFESNSGLKLEFDESIALSRAIDDEYELTI